MLDTIASGAELELWKQILRHNGWEEERPYKSVMPDNPPKIMDGRTLLQPRPLVGTLAIPDNISDAQLESLLPPDRREQSFSSCSLV